MKTTSQKLKEFDQLIKLLKKTEASASTNAYCNDKEMLSLLKEKYKWKFIVVNNFAVMHIIEDCVHIMSVFSNIIYWLVDDEEIKAKEREEREEFERLKEKFEPTI